MPAMSGSPDRPAHRRVVFLSADSLDGFVVDDELAVEPLRRLGVAVDTVSWRRADYPWRACDLVVVRSTWDYHEAPADFLAALGAIASRTRLANSLALVRWNVDKRYLAWLEERGVPIVPTRFLERATPRALLAARDALQDENGAGNGSQAAGEFVVKPAVSASAWNTFRLSAGDFDRRAAELAGVFEGRVAMVQPFVPAIAEEGEFSLFYFDGTFSHAVLKAPAPGDYRVQEEHGGRIVAVNPEAALLSAGCAALATVASAPAEPSDTPPLYARVDLVRCGAGFRLMEVELIEPALYLRMDAGAPERFARAVARRAGLNRAGANRAGVDRAGA